MKNVSWEECKQKALEKSDPFLEDFSKEKENLEKEYKQHRHIHHHIDLFPFLTIGEKRTIFFVWLAVALVGALLSFVSFWTAFSFLP